jgi:hypothetical protein
MTEIQRLALERRAEFAEQKLKEYSDAYFELYAHLPVLLAEFEQEVIRETLAAVEEGDSR